MKLLSNTPFDITEYCGNLIVTYLSDDKAAVQPLLQFLQNNGYEYIENEIGLHTIIKSAYLTNIQPQLDTCGCYILFVSENLNLPENRVLRNSIFYQVGFLEARRQQIVVPYLKDDAAQSVLASTPIQTASAIRSTEGILLALGPDDDRFRSVIIQNTFYADNELNILTRDRIEYRRAIVSMDITETDFRNAYDKFRSRTNDLSMTEQEFFNALQYHMSCGARILSFGTEDKLTTHLYPYTNEQKCLNTIDFPTNFSCSHVYKDDREKLDDLKGNYILEYILPIHKLLGVNFKLFIQAENSMNVDILQMLFASNFSEENDVKIVGNRLYFSLALPNAEPFDFDRGLNIGQLADYLYPQ